MATRSLIGTYHAEDGWRCRYVHWDGYPDGVGAELCRIINRDGVNKAMQVLTVENPYGWSSIAADTEKPRPEAGDRFATVPGYGHAYQSGDGSDDYVLRGDNTGAEWAYLVAAMPSGEPMVDVYEWAYGGGEWRLSLCIDCASGRTLATDLKEGRVNV